MLIVLTVAAAANCSPPQPMDDRMPSGMPPEAVEEIIDKRDPLEISAEMLINTMSLEEKIGQLLIVGFPKGATEEDLQDYIDRYKVSGFILFRRNYSDFSTQYALVKSLKERNSEKNPLPLFISVDEEGGTVSRLPKGGTHFPDARLVGKAGDPQLTYKSGEVIGNELKAAGVNLNFAPVLDIVGSSENKLLVRRAYGSNPDTVSLHGVSFIRGLNSSGVIASPKHFPGHGSTDVDSHGKLPVIDIDEATLQSRELMPFRAAMDNGLDAVMVGHLAFPRLDPTGLPATMSRYFLTNILREEMGFKGIAISDEIEMYGYINGKPSIEECVVTSFNAGLDVFVIGHTKEIQDRVLKALYDACKDGSISVERLNESVLRIIRVKLKYELSDSMEYSPEEAMKVFGSKEHKTVLEEIESKIKGR